MILFGEKKSDKTISELIHFRSRIPNIRKSKIYSQDEKAAQNFFETLKEKTKVIIESKKYKEAKKLAKKENEKKKKVIKDEELSDSEILWFHLSIYYEIYNELKLKKINIIDNKLLQTIEDLTAKQLPPECYYVYIKLMFFIIKYCRIENLKNCIEKMYSILLCDSFLAYEYEIKVITFLIENDYDKCYENLSNEEIIKLINIVFYIILPEKLSEQNNNLLEFIKYCIDSLNIFILPYTIEFLIDTIFYHLLSNKISPTKKTELNNIQSENELNDNNSGISQFNKFIRYFLEIIFFIKKNKKLSISKFLIGKIIFLLFLFKHQIHLKKQEIQQNEKVKNNEKKREKENIKKEKKKLAKDIEEQNDYNYIDINNFYETAESMLSPENFFVKDINNEKEFIELFEISLELYNPKSTSLFKQILTKVKNSLKKIYNEQIMFLVFGTNLKMIEIFNSKLNIFCNEIKNKIKYIDDKGISYVQNSLAEFIYKCYFQKSFFLSNDENKKQFILRRNIHILLTYLELSAGNKSPFLINFLYKLLENYGEDFQYEWKFFLNILYKLKDIDIFKERKEDFIILLYKFKTQLNQGLLLFNDDCFKFINYDDVFKSLSLEILKIEYLLNDFENLKYFQKLVDFYKNINLNEENKIFYTQVFFKLLDTIIDLYIKNCTIKSRKIIEDIIMNNHNIIINFLGLLDKNKYKYQYTWYNKLIIILCMTKKIEEESLFQFLIQPNEDPSQDEILFFCNLLKKLNDLKQLEKIRIIINNFNEPFFFKFFIFAKYFFVDKEQKIYFSKKDLYNKKYISYIQLSHFDNKKDEKENNEQIVYLNISKKILENFINSTISFNPKITFFKKQFKYMYFFKGFDFSDIYKLLEKIILEKGANIEYIKIMSLLNFTLDNEESTKYNTVYTCVNHNLKTEILKGIYDLLDLIINNNEEKIKKIKANFFNYLVELISLFEFYIYSFSEINGTYLDKIIKLFGNIVNYGIADSLNFLILRFFYINKNLIIKNLNNENSKIVYDIIFKNGTNNQNKFNDFEIYEEEEKKEKNFYLKRFMEIILFYYIENENFRTVLIQNIDNIKDLFIYQLIQNNISINNPRNNFDKNDEKKDSNSKIYSFNQGIFEILNDNVNSLHMIIRKPLFTVEMNVKSDFCQDKIIIKDEKKKSKILDSIYNKNEEINVDEIENEEKKIDDNNNIFNTFLESITEEPINDNLKEIKDKNKDNISSIDNLPVYYTFSSTIIYLQDKEINSEEYIFDLEKDNVSNNFISFINSLGKLIYHDEDLIIINYRDSIIDFNFECYIPKDGKDKEDIDNDLLNSQKNKKYLNVNKNLSCIIFLENPYSKINKELFKEYPFIFIIYPFSNEHHLVKFYNISKKEFNLGNFVELYIFYVNDSYKLFSNYLIQTLVSLNIINYINDDISPTNSYSINNKINERKKLINEI